MTFRLLKHAPLCAALTGAWLGLAETPAQAQHKILGQPRPGYCPPPPDCLPAPVPSVIPVPKAGETPKVGEMPKTDTPPAQLPSPDLPSEQGAAAGGESFAASTGLMMGDTLGIPALAFSNRSGSSGSSGAAVIPTARGFKVADNESPRPLDRLYYGFNYFDNVNRAVNDRIGAPISSARAYRNTFGFEKTFFDQNASIGFRVPLNTLDANSTINGFGGNNTSAGDLTMITKYMFYQDYVTGSLLSGGLAVTFPTGPGTFAGANIAGTHSTNLQPYVGYIFNRDRFFVHGFSAFAFATQSDDVTYYTFDTGICYRLYSARDPGRIVTSIVPTIEMHVNVPLNHRGALNTSDPIGAADGVNFTYGTSIGLGRRSTLAMAFVTPVTGPKPFDYEFLVQFNWRFGGSIGTPGTGILGN